ncbi:MAG: hypothetical protein FJX59_05885 [Alphaproteobacteria bacterium]|nr:hypothetical protein [Alphaproteobacteria bacterium]
MSQGRVQFEVQICRGGKWTISEVLPTEDGARRKADDLLAQKGTEGVRIVKESLFGNDSRRDSEIFKEMKEVDKDEDFTVTPVDDAPLCEQVDDFYEARARTTMARMFSKYLEKHEMTPFEMLHSHKSLKRIMNKDNIVSSAVDKIAALHARATGADTRKRKDLIFNAVDRIAAKARDVDSKPLPELKGGTLDQLWSQIDAKFTDEAERKYMASVALARASVNWTGWLGKMAELLPKAKDLKDERARVMVDDMMSDILVARTVIKDVIGVSKHMGDAVLRMLDLIEGKCAPTKFAAEDLVELLNYMFGNQLLPRSKSVLFERIERDLKSPVRLTNSEEPNGDKDFFVQLLNRVVTDHGVYGGRPMALGLTERWARLINMGGATGRKKAMEEVRDKLNSTTRKFVYLIAMFEPKEDPNLADAIAGKLTTFVAQLDTVQKIAPEAKTQKARLQEAAMVQKIVLQSQLIEPLKSLLATKFDDVVSNYIITNKVIERIDDKALSFRERASRLVAFCAGGVLTEGKAKTIARDSVVSYLRRKDFVSEYTADVAEPAEKERAIREFYALLAKTGFDMRG